MGTEIYRVVVNLNKEKLTISKHKLFCKEANLTFSVIDGKSGFASVIHKKKMGLITSGALYECHLSGFHLEAFCYPDEEDDMAERMLERTVENFNKAMDNFKAMEKHLNAND